MEMEKPKIRFKGYQEDWEQRKLKEIANKVSEKNKNNEFSEPFTNSAEQGIISQKDYFDREIVNNENLDGYYIVRNDDFIYNPRISVTAPVGPINRNRLGRNGVMSPLYTVFRTHDIDNLYLEFYFKTTRWHRFMKLNGDSGARFDRFTISSTQFMEMPIPYPTLDEQQTIGKYFDSLDHLITLHQRKCEETKILKKYMLQKMFPQNGHSVPEIRFSGFTEDWEQRKLPEFVTFFNGLTYTPNDVEETGTLVLRSSNVKNGEIVDADNVYVNDKVATSENVEEDDIIVVVRNGSRALIGKHAQIKASMPNTVIGAFMIGMRSEHSSFVNALLDTSAFENEIAKNMGATINQITGYMFSKMEFMIPSGEEQQQIGEYFQSLDHLITLHQQKCDELRNIKKFMLQNMFI